MKQDDLNLSRMQFGGSDKLSYQHLLTKEE